MIAGMTESGDGPDETGEGRRRPPAGRARKASGQAAGTGPRRRSQADTPAPGRPGRAGSDRKPAGAAPPPQEAIDTWRALGEFIRSQRELASLSMRQLASLAKVSNPYLSQVERGLYRPSAQVLKSLADALKISAESLYSQVGLLDEEVSSRARVEQAIRVDQRLSKEQKDALLRVYRSFLS